VLEARLGTRVGVERRGAVVARCHRPLEPAELEFDREQVAGPREDVVAQGSLPVARRTLVVERDTCSLAERELAAVRAHLAGEHAQERRLAGAVRARQGDTILPLDLE
jgi:hypothetical protein